MTSFNTLYFQFIQSQQIKQYNTIDLSCYIVLLNCIVFACSPTEIRNLLTHSSVCPAQDPCLHNNHRTATPEIEGHQRAIKFNYYLKSIRESITIVIRNL